jgi:anti-anti-sigma factor
MPPMELHPLQVTVEALPGVAVVHVAGDVSALNIDPFRQGIATAIAKKSPKLVIDLTNTAFLSSPGLAVLVQTLQLSQRGNMDMVLAGANERVRGIFEIARLTDVFKIVPTLDDALGR